MDLFSYNPTCLNSFLKKNDILGGWVLKKTDDKVPTRVSLIWGVSSPMIRSSPRQPSLIYQERRHNVSANAGCISALNNATQMGKDARLHSR